MWPFSIWAFRHDPRHHFLLLGVELLRVVSVHRQGPPDCTVHRARPTGTWTNDAPLTHARREVPPCTVRLLGRQDLGLPAYLAPVFESLRRLRQSCPSPSSSQASLHSAISRATSTAPRPPFASVQPPSRSSWSTGAGPLALPDSTRVPRSLPIVADESGNRRVRTFQELSALGNRQLCTRVCDHCLFASPESTASTDSAQVTDHISPLPDVLPIP